MVSQLDDLRRQQRSEYHEFVLKVYQELMLKKKESRKKTIVKKAIKELKKTPSQQLMQLDNPGSPSTPKESLWLKTPKVNS
jgi:hypothetical protein